jgi:hypothetical protein
MQREMELIIRARHRHRAEMAVKYVPSRQSGNGVPSGIGAGLTLIQQSKWIITP